MQITSAEGWDCRGYGPPVRHLSAESEHGATPLQRGSGGRDWGGDSEKDYSPITVFALITIIPLGELFLSSPRPLLL